MATSVLILEDDPSFLQVLQIKLKSWQPDVNITHVDTISAARKLLSESQQTFQLAILDQHLPDGMGHELISDPNLHNTAILAVSSDDAPELPAKTVMAGAQHFLAKRQVTEGLFVPLIAALVERKIAETKLLEFQLKEKKLQTIRRLLATLKHEINNPLGAVIGAAYLIRSNKKLSPDQEDAVKLIEESGKRIKHVIQELCGAADLEEVTKATEEVFQVPGDKPWES